MTGRPAKPRDERPIYRVAQIDREVRFLLEEAYADIWVEGEISNLRPTASGHSYFRLNDLEEKASLDCAIFRGDLRRVRTKLADGLRVRCRGRLSIYEAQGRFQLIASQVEAAGLGEILARIEALEARLAEEGLFDEARKRSLPRLPRSIGVVTSRTGAAIRDVIQVATRRFPVRILVAHAAVQGDAAPSEIVSAMGALERRSDVDVILVTRGGGSVEDLMAFNDEGVVRAIAGSRVPVVSAVGHEIDTTLCDLVADVCAPTPSAAAEILVPEREALRADLRALSRRLAGAAERELHEVRRDLDALARSVLDPGSAIATHRQTLDHLVGRAERVLRRRSADARMRTAALDRRLERLHPRARLVADRARLRVLADGVRRTLRASLVTARGRSVRCESALAALSPLAVLGRGYSITLDLASGRAVRDPSVVGSGDPLEIVVEKGRLKARVE